MNPCRKCGNKDHSTIVITTETTFGHGDSTHVCCVECKSCGHKAKPEAAWGIFEINTFRKAQENWNNEIRI